MWAFAVIAAEGFHLLPGIIDPQVHFREPGQPEKEDLQSGSAAAASGGVTSFLDMPNNNPSAVTLESIMDKIAVAGNKCITHHGFFIGATPNNVRKNAFMTLGRLKYLTFISEDNFDYSQYE